MLHDIRDDTPQRAARRRRFGLLAILAIGCAYATPVQGVGSNQNAHYALVRALADGTATIDRTRHEVGDLGTDDISRFDGHDYANKAPGLAFTTLSMYLLLEAGGADLSGDPSSALWALGLVGVVLPATVVLLLVRRLADDLAPGLGTAAAATLGLGTLFLPFSTMFFAHSLSTFFAFAAFALLWTERRSRPRLERVAAAGGLAGLAVTVEYPLALIGALVGIYAVSRGNVIRRGLAYSVGVLVGVTPLLLYNWAAFASPATFSYEGAIFPGTTRHDVRVDEGVLGVGIPSFRSATELLFAHWWRTEGLLITAPVLVAAVVATVLVYRRGWRAEAAVIAAIAVSSVVYVSGYFGPFGDVPPGPRYLIPMLPFLAVPLAVAYRTFPAPTVLLALASGLTMLAVTATPPISAWDGHTLDRLTSPQFEGYSRTYLYVIGIVGPLAIAPFFVTVLVAFTLTILATRLGPISGRAWLAGAASVVAWGLIVMLAPRAFAGGELGEVLLIALVVTIVLAIARLTETSGDCGTASSPVPS